MNNQNSIILAMIVATVLFSATVSQQPARAGDDFGRLGDAIDRCLKNCVNNYNQGVGDGKQAALAGESDNCPGSGADYCLGWNTGYNKISSAQGDIEEAQQDSGGNNEDDN